MANGTLDLSEFGGNVVQAAAPQAQTPPAQPAALDLSEFGGQRVTPVGATPSQAAAPLVNQTPGSNGADDSAIGKYMQAAGKVATGFAEGAGDTVSSVSHLLHKIPVVGETLAPEQGISALDKMDIANSTEEKVGKGIEGVAEFAGGDEALKGLTEALKITALAKNSKRVAEVLNMAKEHPILAKIITSSMRGSAVGAAQGAKEGVQKGNAAGGAEAGAVAGALQGPIEAAGDAVTYFARRLGIGGLNSAEAIVKAGRPNVGEGKRFGEAWLNVTPLLRDDPAAKSIQTVGDFEDVLHNKAQEIWQNDVNPLVVKHGNETIETGPIRDRIRAAITGPMKRHFPEEAAAIENRANEFNIPTATKRYTVAEADETLQAFNAKLQKYYKAAPGDKSAILKTDGDVAALEAAADGLREQLYSKIDQKEGLPDGVTRQIRSQYGSLKELERVFGKRAVVADRATPMNLSQVLGATEAAAALAAGHPLVAAAGVVPSIIKHRGSPESLIKQGLSAAREEAGQTGVVRKAGQAIGNAVARTVPSIAAQTAAAYVPEGAPALEPGMVRIQDSVGAVHDIPQEAIAAAQTRDPGMRVLEGGK